MLRENFKNGRMNLDADERLLPEGDHREALNINIVNSEGSDVGAIENSLSNKLLTSIDFGPNPKTISWLEDEPEDKIYWHVKSDTGCFLMEWDDVNQVSSFILKDTRPQGQRILDLHEDFLITGMVKVISEDTNEDLLMWTDDNMQPCCINIERSKSWGENNFDLEDILLIKKPPRYAPIVTPTYVNDFSNNIEDKFPSVSYRYKYRDGEYSALSDSSNYAFYPKLFDLDYYTLENKGMISAYNGMLIKFNTGDKRVTDIQIVLKFSNSNSLYIVETFNKSDLSWRDNEMRQSIFSNDKLYMQLDSNQLSRAFDNVPLKAKALALISNIPVFGNYLEGRDIEYPIDFSLANLTQPLTVGNDFGKSVLNNSLQFTNPDGLELTSGSRLTLYLSLELNSIATYDGDFFLILDQDYSSLDEIFSSESFSTLLEVMNSSLVNNYNSDGSYEVPDGWVVFQNPTISYQLVQGVATLLFSPVIYRDTFNSNAQHIVPITPTLSSYATLYESTNSTSVKTNRSVSVGLVYQDCFNRRTTVLSSANNSIFIPQKNSKYRNIIRAIINNRPPSWADRYKLVVKAQPLQYQTIYVNTFYNEDSYVWCKLEAENKDKVKVGDILIVKAAAGDIVIDPVEVKVLELAYKEKDFIEGNIDEEGLNIVETSGTYMKIRAEGFSMDFKDYKVLQSEGEKVRSSNYPVTGMPVFTTIENGTVIEELSIPAGSSIRIVLDSWREYDNYQGRVIYDHTHYAQRDYDTLEEWMNENFLNRYIKGIRQHDGENVDYRDNVSLKRGYLKRVLNTIVFVEDNNPTTRGLHLVTKGIYSGGSKNRQGNVKTKIEIRTSQGFYVFETKEKQAENNVYYETEQCFDIVNGNHIGNVQDQDANTFIPAIIDLDFFNCYTQGNGVESYRVKDGFNTNYLNIDLRPSATSVEKYRAVRRFADLTYGGAFIESSSVNKLNEFNLALGNWKELDKQYGSIQRLESRESDLLVWQEDKASKVLFGKDLINTAEGVGVITRSSEILGQQILIPGENGIGLNPESLAKDIYRYYWVNARRGTPVRYSMDGMTEINYGMISFFRDLFIRNPLSKKIGGYDPYHKQYFISVEEDLARDFILQCGNSISKTVVEPFVFYLKLNDRLGDIVFNYNVSDGIADIRIEFDGQIYLYESLTGIGILTIPRSSLEVNMVRITLYPITSSTTVYITGICPITTMSRVGIVVLCDESDQGTIMKNRYRSGANAFYEDTHVFSEGPISKFTIEQGEDGSVRFPANGDSVNIQAYKDGSSTGSFNLDKCNRIGYLVSPNIYSQGDTDILLANTIWLQLTETQISSNSLITQSSFVLNKNDNSDILYLVWDYRDLKPISRNIWIRVNKGGSYIVDLLSEINESLKSQIEVEIIIQPTNGTVLVNEDKTVTYTHNGSGANSDSFVYQLNSGVCSSDIATVTVAAFNDDPLPCNEGLTYVGYGGFAEHTVNFGEGTGSCGISYNITNGIALIEIYYEGINVATTVTEVFGAGSLTFQKSTSSPATATVMIFAGPDAEWNMNLICPV